MHQAVNREIEYLPEPPDTVETGPSGDTKSPDQIWVPGSWVWHHGRYAWRSGYWTRVEPNWLWVPAHYTWTPRGYVFVDGYWDYPVVRRGVLFAPVYFEEPVYVRSGFYYSPAIVINLGLFTDHLFVRPHHHHYYFGDYYAAEYYGVGIFPWFEFHYSRYGYDPIYAHHRWHHLREDRQWESRIKADFQHRREHEESRPPHTLAQLKEVSSRGEKSKEKSLVVATSLNEVAKSKDGSVRFESLDDAKRKEIGQRAQEVHKSREERQNLEVKPAAKPAGKPTEKPAKPEKPAEKTEPDKLKMPKSPVVGKPADKLGKDETPPKAHESPKPDPKIEPKPRKPGDRPEPSKATPKTKKGDTKSEPAKAESKEKPKGGEKPKGEKKEKPKGESKGKPDPQPKEKPKGESKEKDKDKPSDKESAS